MKNNITFVMRIHLIRKETVATFARHNSSSRTPLADWLSKLKYADWQVPSDILATFKTADLLGHGSNRVVFDIGDNNYRIIGKYFFGAQKVHLYIKWIGTHSAYTKLCNAGDQYAVETF